MANQIPSQTIYGDIFDYSLFTEAEQARLAALPLAQLADRLNTRIADRTKTASAQELEDFYCFLELQAALIADDKKEIAHWRLRLSMTQEELIARFRSLDLSRLPPENTPGIAVQRRHIIYSLSRIHHQVYSSGKDYAQMCVWIEYYQLQGWL